MSLHGLRREYIDGTIDALFQVHHGLAIFSRVNCVLQEIQRTFKDFYNVQWNFVWHRLSPCERIY